MNAEPGTGRDARVPGGRRRQMGYGAAVFLCAAGGLVIEIVAGRLLAPYVGMSLYTWTAIIAVVLAGLSIGHWIGGRLAGPGVDGARGARRVTVALFGASISSLASLVLLRVLSGPLLQSGMGAIPVIVALSAGLFLLPSLFVGIVSPILTKLAIDDQPGHHGRVLGRMYALGATGSIVGTLAAGYIFISWIGSTGTVISVAVMYALLALAFVRRWRDAATFVPALALLATGIGNWAAERSAFTSPCLVESDYYCIRIDDFSRVSGRPSRIMVIDHLAHSINDRDDPALLYSPYIHFVDELARRRFPGGKAPDAYFLGGGGYSLPRAWSRRDPSAKLVVAEIDPAVTRVARSHLWFERAGAMRILHDDGRVALQAMPTTAQFDVVFVDAFQDISIPAHLVTREFHAEVAQRLRPTGFYAINVVDGGRTPRFLFAMVRTLSVVFPEVSVWVETEDADTSGRTTYMVVAGRAPLGTSAITARRGVPRSWQAWPAKDLAARIAAADPPVLDDDFAPVDRLLSHILLRGDVAGN